MQDLYIRAIKTIPRDGIQEGTPVANVGELIQVKDMGNVYHCFVNTLSGLFGYCIPLECGAEVHKQAR